MVVPCYLLILYIFICHYMAQPLVELYGGCMVVLKVANRRRARGWWCRPPATATSRSCRRGFGPRFYYRKRLLGSISQLLGAPRGSSPIPRGSLPAPATVYPYPAAARQFTHRGTAAAPPISCPAHQVSFYCILTPLPRPSDGPRGLRAGRRHHRRLPGAVLRHIAPAIYY
jgi:hypothetical protein